MLKQKNYTTLQGWMVSELKLSGLELICYALIYGFTQDEESVFMGSRKYLSQWLGCSLPTVDKTLKTLIDKGLIEKHTEVINNVTFNRYKHVALNDNFIPHKKTLGGAKDVLGGAKDVLHDNNIDNNSNTSIETINIKEINNKKELKEKFANFVSLYKKMGGRARGIDTEFNDFTKRHKDWASVIPYLSIAVQREEEERAKAQFEKRFFPEPKLLQTYLGKQRAWELYVTVGEEINDNEYRPKTTIELRWNDIYNCYLYTGQSWNPFPTDIYDGYTKENRPDGARIMLNNGRGYIHWSSEFKEWLKD